MEDEWDNKVTIVTRDGFHIPALAILGRDSNPWSVTLTVDGYFTLVHKGDVVNLTTKSGRSSPAEVRRVTGTNNNTTGEHKTEIHATVGPFPWLKL